MKNKKPLYPGLSNSDSKLHQAINQLHHAVLSDVNKPQQKVMEDILSSMDTKELTGMVDEVTQSHAMLKTLADDPRVKRAIRESALDNFPLKSLRKQYGLVEIVKWFFVDLFIWARGKLMKDTVVRRISLKPWYRVNPEERQILIQWLMKKINKLLIENPMATTEGRKPYNEAISEFTKREKANDPNVGKTLQKDLDLVNFTQDDYEKFEKIGGETKNINLQEFFENSLKNSK